MSINSRFAMDQTKARKNGRFYGSIDFECNDKVSAQVFKNDPNRPTIGEFLIGNSRFPVTMEELELMEQTCREARETVMKRYRLGMMGRLD
jgi:hypothetical protein